MHLSTSGPPSHRGLEEKVVAAKKAACEMKALFAQPVVTVVTAFLMLSVAVIASYLPRQIQKN